MHEQFRLPGRVALAPRLTAGVVFRRERSLPGGGVVTRKRKWTLRVVGVAVLAVAALGIWLSVNAQALRARYAAQKLAAATTDDERTQWANALAGYGEPGIR